MCPSRQKEGTAANAQRHPTHQSARKKRGLSRNQTAKTNKIVICESTIDAISYFSLQPDCMAISTSGAYAKPAWLNILIEKGYEIFCGFDNDETGDILANKMIRFFPTVKRLRPTKHDWNEILVSKYKAKRGDKRESESTFQFN